MDVLLFQWMPSLDLHEKSAGQSHRDPLYGHIFFENQRSVDEHVAAAPQRNRADKGTFFLC